MSELQIIALKEQMESLQRALNRERDELNLTTKERNSLRTRNNKFREHLVESQRWICSEVCGVHHIPFCVKLLDFLHSEGRSWEITKAAHSGLPPGRIER